MSLLTVIVKLEGKVGMCTEKLAKQVLLAKIFPVWLINTYFSNFSLGEKIKNSNIASVFGITWLF